LVAKQPPTHHQFPKLPLTKPAMTIVASSQFQVNNKHIKKKLQLLSA
jgi:hypothetical protein